MVHARHGLDDVVLALRHVEQAGTMVEILVVALARHGTHAINRALETVKRNLREVGHAFQIVAGCHDALLGEGFVFRRMFLDGIGNRADLVIPEHPAVAAGLLQDGFGQNITALQFFHKALAFLIEHDGTVKASVRNQFDYTRNRVADRIGLDVTHVDKLGTRALGHIESFTCCARSIRRLEALVNLRVVLFDHLRIGTEAARRKHHATLGVKGVGVPVHRRLDANDTTALILNEFFSLHVGDDGNAQFISLSLELGDEFRTGVTNRNQSAFTGVPAEEEEIVVFKANAEVVTAPLGSVKGVVRQHIDHLGIALLVTAEIRVLGVQFRRVVVNTELRLNPILSCVHFSAGNQRVAADSRHLFQQDDIGAGILSFNRSGETCTARTDHDHVIGRFFRQSLDNLLDRLLIGLAERYAGLLGHSVQKPLRRESSAGNGVELHGIRVNDVLLEIREDLSGEHRIFLLLDDLDVLDLAAVKSHGNSHVAVLADTGTLCRHRTCRYGGCKSRANQPGNQSARKTHIYFPSVVNRQFDAVSNKRQ